MRERALMRAERRRDGARWVAVGVGPRGAGAGAGRTRQDGVELGCVPRFRLRAPLSPHLLAVIHAPPPQRGSVVGCSDELQYTLYSLPNISILNFCTFDVQNGGNLILPLLTALPPSIP